MARKRGSTATTRNRPAECSGCGMKIRTTRTWVETVGLPTCACGGAFQLTDIEDLVTTGEVDARELDARTLRSLGWDGMVQARPKRHTRQKQCPCGRFVSRIAETCSAGHVQDWARGLVATPAMPF